MGTASGFGQLSVVTSGTYNDTAQMYAAGYLEGALTASRIGEHYANVHAWIADQFTGNVIPPKFQTFFETQVRSQGARPGG